MHGHDLKECDLIAYWEHNWPECPQHLEVIPLVLHDVEAHTMG